MDKPCSILELFKCVYFKYFESIFNTFNNFEHMFKCIIGYILWTAHYSLMKHGKNIDKKIAQSPGTNIPESNWEYKITNNDNNNNNNYIYIYIYIKENCWSNSDLLIKEFI